MLLGGQVTLRVLPEAVLTATDVALPDQGDGVSAQLGALRLQVAVLPLLAGRIVPRDLVLGAPVLRLPWPLPQGITHPARPLVPHGFAAHMEDGTLRMGGVQISGINAGIHGGPEPGETGLAQPGSSSASGFGAEGFAAFGGRTWRFTSALGVPDADGVSALDLSVTGQGPAGKTGGSVQGTLADGVVQGRLRAGGPDLSLLMQADSLPWRIEAPFVADGERIEANAVGLSLGGSRADGALVLRLAPPARLDGRLHAASLSLDGWMRVLNAARRKGWAALPALPFRLAVSSGTAQLMGGTLAGLQGALVSDGASLTLDQMEARLPGQALLSLGGAITDGPDGLQVQGPASLDAPDLHAVLAWLHGWSPGLIDAVPRAVLQRARLTGEVTLAPEKVSVSGLSGEIDGANVSGAFGITTGARSRVSASLSVAQLPVDDWLGRPAPGATMASIGRGFVRIDSDLHIRAGSASWYGVVLTGLALDAHTGPAGLAVDRATASLSNATITVKGALGPDGSVAGATLAASTPDTSALLALLPASWRLVPGLWTGAGSLEAALSGAPDALGLQLRADAGDLVLEAEWRADALRRSAAGTVTLRHPGTPRLLAALGIGGAERWLETGSLALRAQVTVRPGRVSVPDFDLAAADLRLGGQLDLDLSTAEPFLRGDVDADMLALPEPADWPPFAGALRDWAAQLHVIAHRFMLGGEPQATDLKAAVGFGGGNGLVDVAEASAAGGKWSGQLAFAAREPLPLLALRAEAARVQIAAPFTGLPVDLTAGEADGSVDLQASGAGVAAWRRSLTGQVTVLLRGAQFSGFDLSQAGQALTLPGRAVHAALQTALSSGRTADLSGMATLDVAQGRWTLAPSLLGSPKGTILVQGTADADGALDIGLLLQPAGSTVTGLGLRLSGPFDAASAVPDFGSAGNPSPLRTRRPKHR